MLRTQMAENFKTVHSGQNNIQHNQIDRRCLGFTQSFFAVMDDDWIVPGFRQC
jgi:hypothetical protein